MNCTASLSVGGKARIQLLLALGADFTPSAGKSASYTSDLGGGDSERPLYMVFYKTTLVPLAEEIQTDDPGIIDPFYV